jgi:phosphatidylserine/phosphatidylglycerophosphate/cardiolipin synthase-like enzyme
VAPLVAFIRAASHSLDGEAYELTSKPVAAALVAAAHRGVSVRIALAPHPEGASRSLLIQAYRTLAAGGVHVEWTSSMFTYTHARYLVADGSRAWIGSPNWTAAAFKPNRAFAVVDTDPGVVSEADAVFTADWAHRPFTGNAACLVLSPKDSRSRITALSTGARRTLDVYAEEVNDAAQEDALIAAAHRGVRVRVVCTGDGDVSRLRAGGVQVVVDKALYIHAKAIVADGAIVFIGSENISSTSLDKNRRWA